MSARGRPGLALGSGLAVTVVLAVAVPSGLVVRDHLMGFDEPAAAVAADVDAAAAAAATAAALKKLQDASAAAEQHNKASLAALKAADAAAIAHLKSEEERKITVVRKAASRFMGF